MIYVLDYIYNSHKSSLSKKYLFKKWKVAYRLPFSSLYYESGPKNDKVYAGELENSCSWVNHWRGFWRFYSSAERQLSFILLWEVLYNEPNSSRNILENVCCLSMLHICMFVVNFQFTMNHLSPWPQI